MYEKMGVVVSVDPSKPTARVMFESLDNLVSDELQLIGQGWMPIVGDYVFCSFTQQKKGFILGTVADGGG